MISGFEFAHETYTDPRQSGELLLWQFLRLGLIADQNAKAFAVYDRMHSSSLSGLLGELTKICKKNRSG